MVHQIISRTSSSPLETYNVDAYLQSQKDASAIGTAHVIRSVRRPSSGYLELEKGTLIDIIATKSDSLPEGFCVARSENGRVGLVERTVLQLSRDYLRFGTDLTVSYNGTHRRVPKVISSAISFLRKKGLFEKGIFRVSGRSSDVERLKIAFENDIDLLENAVHDDISASAVAGVLKLFLRSLPNPVFTRNLYETFLELGRLTDESTRVERLRGTIINYLPLSHLHLLKELMIFLHEISQHEDKNKMSVSNLAVVFAPSLLRRGNFQALQPHTKQANDVLKDEPFLKEVVSTCITHAEAIFMDLPVQGDDGNTFNNKSHTSAYDYISRERANTAPTSIKATLNTSSDFSAGQLGIDPKGGIHSRPARSSPLSRSLFTDTTATTTTTIPVSLSQTSKCDCESNVNSGTGNSILTIDACDWTPQQLAVFLQGSGLCISEYALWALSHVNGSEFLRLNKEKLRIDFGLHETDVAKVASLIFQLADPRAHAS
eukprot:gene8143-784_t